MKTKTLPLRNRMLAGAMFFAFTLNLLANPTGMTVVSGTASAQVTGSQLSITTSQNAFLNWQSFNIAAGERTIFNQPSASSIVVNQINDRNASQIYGSLQANGIIVLMNSSGFYFGPNSFVSAAGLVVSTANCTPPQNFGGTWQFNGPPPLASIVNYGSIKVGNGGYGFLIADKIENHGDVEAPGGNIGFAAGQTVTLSERPDGRGMSMQVTLPQGSVDNYGNVIADGGTIALNAKVVNQDGLIQANSVQNQNGVIELVASDSLNLGANSQITANGDANGDSSASGSAGGNVTLKSDNTFSDVIGSEISVAGGDNGGNGGRIEISARNVSSLHSRLDAAAKAGWIGGSFLLDPPDYLTLDGGLISSFFGFNSITLQANYDITLADYTSWDLSASTGQSSGQLTLEAGRNIIFGNASSIVDANGWSVNLLAGVGDFVYQTVQPGVGSIIVDSGDSFNPSFIRTASGAINLVAGQAITLGFGYINTTGGGSITAHALTGNIDTGFLNAYAQNGISLGYYFQYADTASAGCVVGPLVGGISTLSGGDVKLTAGGDVTSVLPTQDGYYYGGTLFSTPGTTDGSAGSGAYGNQSGQAGNVTIVAGGNVTGHYLVANGVGSIFAGVKMDTSGNPLTDLSGKYIFGMTGSAGIDDSSYGLALSLIQGGWNVVAAQNIYLQEVRNPNGVFNVFKNPNNNSTGGSYHYFDYAPGDYVDLNAGNLVVLGSTVLPRDNSGNNNDGFVIPIIYPSILNISAGAGGVTLTGNSIFNQLILFPSSQGSLEINTTGSGSLSGLLPTSGGFPQIFNLIVSDASGDQHQYLAGGTFGITDHAATPIHLNNPTPITLDIAGDMNLVSLIVPEAAQLKIGGNMVNCRFQGMNLAANDVTSIAVTGDIKNSSGFTSVDLNALSTQIGWQAPDFSYFSRALSSNPSGITLADSFHYDPATKILTYQSIPGISLKDLVNLLESLTVQKVDSNGNLLWLDSPFNTIPATETVSVINAATGVALINQYTGPAPVNSGSSGYIVGGGGKFDVSAQNINLGTSAGIQSKGAGLYEIQTQTSAQNFHPLANLFGTGGVFQNGADINVEASGSLFMYSSSIATLNGGNISVRAGNAISVGAKDFSVPVLSTRGIYSSGGGDVSVIAGSDINVNGSRIATYDGGNVTVESILGNVDAGTGASTPASVQAYYVNPVTHQLYQETPQIPFSGILAMTFPARDASYPAPVATLGNILVEAPNGDVSANLSGVLQIPLNGLNYPNALVTVLAGYEMRDSLGHAVSAANMMGATPVLSLSAQNLVTDAALGSSGDRLLLVEATGKLDANGNPTYVPKLDANGNPIFVSQLANGFGQTVFTDNSTINSADIAKTFSQNHLRLELVNPSGDGLLGPDGNQLYVVQVTDTLNNPQFVLGRNINAAGSGIIASNARLDATGDINGLIFARNNIDVVAQQNVNVTALGEGTVSIGAGGSVSGTIIGVGGISASGGSIDASLVSANVSGSTSGQSGLGAGGAANATANAASASDDTDKLAKKTDDTGEDDPTKKKGKGIALAQKVSRVTVLLPPKKLSEKTTVSNPL